MEDFLQKAKKASREIALLSGDEKNRLLQLMADALVEQCELIITSNANDMEAGSQNGLSSAMMDRLMLNEHRIGQMAQALREIAMLKEPVGRILDGCITGNGLRIEKVAVPIGVEAIIYETPPNDTQDATS